MVTNANFFSAILTRQKVKARTSIFSFKSFFDYLQMYCIQWWRPLREVKDFSWIKSDKKITRKLSSNPDYLKTYKIIRIKTSLKLCHDYDSNGFMSIWMNLYLRWIHITVMSSSFNTSLDLTIFEINKNLSLEAG